MEKYIRGFSLSLRDVGLEHVKAGETSLEEVLAAILDCQARLPGPVFSPDFQA